MDFEEDQESETEEEVPKRRGRPVGAKNKPKEAPPPPPTPTDVYSALQERIAYLEASAKKVAMKQPPRKKEPIRLVGSPTNAAKQLCEILRRDGVLPPAREQEPPYVRESARQKREALYASFLP
jgi:hypothetical protein